jgi:hypothetical protein
MAVEKIVNIQVNEVGITDINKKVNELNANVEETTKAAKELSKATNGDNGTATNSIFSQLKDGAQKLVPALKGVESGLIGVSARMWDLVKNPVGLVIAGVVASLKFLYEAFQSSVAGGKEIKAVFAGVSAVGTQVKDAVFGLARSFIDVSAAAYKFITLDFKGAAEMMKKANKEASTSYNQLSNAIDGTTFSIVRNLEKRQQANDKARKMQDVVQSETNKLLVQSREILTDETASIKEKEKALQAVTKAEMASSKEKVRVAKEDLDILKEKAKALGGEEEKKMKGQIREATIALNEAETENAMTGIKLNKQKKMLHREELAMIKEIADAKKAKQKELDDAEKIRTDKIKEERKKELEELRAFNLARYQGEMQSKLDEESNRKERLANISAENDAIDALELERIERLKKQHDQELSDLEKAEQAKAEVIAIGIDNMESIGQSMQVLAGKNKALAKAGLIIENAAGIAKIVINTQLAATKSMSTFPGPAGIAFAAVNYAAGALSVAASIKATANAMKELGGGSAGSAPSIQNGGAGGSSTAPQFNIVGQNSNNQLAQSIGAQQQRPIEAFVVSGNVTTGQQADRNRIKTATFGS